MIFDFIKTIVQIVNRDCDEIFEKLIFQMNQLMRD